MIHVLVGLLAAVIALLTPHPLTPSPWEQVRQPAGRGGELHALSFSPLPQGEGQGGRAVIDAANIARLHSARQIDFADVPTEAGEVRSGWFAADAGYVMVRTRAETLLLLDERAQLIDSYFVPGADGLPTTILDAALWTGDDLPVMASLHTDGARYFVAQHTATRAAPALAQLDAAQIPLTVWIDGDVWLELLPQTPETPEVVQAYRGGERVSERLNAAETDPDSIIRIGRILPPQAITVTAEGLVRLWNLETGDLVHAAAVDGLPQFGAVNAVGTYFAWRGGDSYAINLLNFETGENRMIVPDAPLVDWLFVGTSGDVLLGVGYDGQPRVVAWNAISGEMYNLGEHRACNRPPDTVRLSRDGTTLIIGCDTGLDLWRVEGTP